MKPTPALDFLKHTALVYEGEGCLEWPFSQNGHGYGQVVVGGVKQTASRVVCELAHGSAPEGKQAAHSCGNRLCVNPNHIRWDTPIGNNADKLAHGTDVRGEKNGKAVLTPELVRKIRADKGASRKIASRYGVCSGTVRDIRSGRRWSWLS